MMTLVVFLLLTITILSNKIDTLHQLAGLAWNQTVHFVDASACERT